MEHLDIYPIGPSDVDQLQEIGRLTFFETFAEHNTAENIKKYLVEGFSLEKLTAELQHPDARFYFAALDAFVPPRGRGANGFYDALGFVNAIK